MYRTDFDQDRRVLTITVEGFWTLATVLAFSAKMLAIGASIRMKHGHFAIVTDGRNFPVQSTEVARAIEVLDRKGRGITSGPRAIVVRTMLGKFQSERVLDSDNLRTFLDWDAAQAWLDEVWTRQPAA